MGNSPADTGRNGRHVARSPTTTFVWDNAATVGTQWRQVADQISAEAPMPAGMMKASEPNVFA
jgi:hypothetical protein